MWVFCLGACVVAGSLQARLMGLHGFYNPGWHQGCGLVQYTEEMADNPTEMNDIMMKWRMGVGYMIVSQTNYSLTTRTKENQIHRTFYFGSCWGDGDILSIEDKIPILPTDISCKKTICISSSYRVYLSFGFPLVMLSMNKCFKWWYFLSLKDLMWRLHNML